jgi:hypothetical protein
MDKKLMLSWLAAQSQNARITPTDVYTAKLGVINEIGFPKPKTPADKEHERVQGLIQQAAKFTAQQQEIKKERDKRRGELGGGSSPDSIKESRSRGPDGYKGDRTGNEGTRNPKPSGDESGDESGEQSGGGMFDVFDERPNK